MTHLLRLALAAAALSAAGCGDKDETPTGDSGAGGADGTGGSDGTGGTETVYPDGRRILLYYGNGGINPEGSGKASFEAIDQVWKDTYGWNTDHRETWTEDLSDYRMVGLINPGAQDTVAFTDGEIATFVAALEAGTRIVVFGDRTGCGAAAVTDIVSALGGSMSFTGDSAAANSIVQTDSYNSGTQLGAGMSDTIRMKEPCYVNPTGGDTVLRDDDGNVLVASQQIGSGGDVVLVGDFQFMDDGSNYLDSGDTQVFANNLVVVDPDYDPNGGSDTGGRR